MALSLAALKLFGIVITGCFAVLGLLVDYRDKAGKITRWGTIALIGIVTSTALTLVSQTMEQQNDRAAAAEAARRTIQELERHSILLNQISRTLEPLHDIKISYFIELDAGDVIAFREKVKVGVGK